MNFRFDPSAGPIVVPARLWGPNGSTVARLALDTGATWTLVNWDVLVLLGYDPAAAPERKQITTASSVELVPRLTVSKIQALLQERESFPLLCHTLPPSAGIDGLLGLDFLRDQRLVVDFRAGLLTLE